MDILRATRDIKEKELRVFFYDTMGRPPSRKERSFIKDLIHESTKDTDTYI